MITEKIARETKPREKPFMICDAGGLYLHVAVTGRKTWIYRKQRRGQSAQVVTLGVYPAMSLYAARQARDETAGKAAQKTAGVVTFRELAEKYFHEVVERVCTQKHIERTAGRLKNYIYPHIAATALPDLTSPDVYKIVEKVKDERHAELAHRIVGLVGQVLRYGIPLGLVPQGDVTRDLREALPPVKNRARPHLETPAEVGALMRKISALPAGMTRAGLLLQAYTFVRPGELRAALWSEIDIPGATWRIPAEKMKMRKPHVVPLSHQVLALLSWLKDGLSFGSPFVLHAERSAARPMSDMRLLAALREMGYGADELCVHGFRATASTLLNEHQWPADYIELQLAHVPGGVRAVYNYAQYLDARRTMMQWWADYLDALRDGAPIPEKYKT